MNIGRIVKSELKKEFPHTKFRVKSDVLSVKIYWENGPGDKEVSDITDKYEEGHFNSRTECYELSNWRDDIPQRKYVFLNREAIND
jgi:hypothetical protein